MGVRLGLPPRCTQVLYFWTPIPRTWLAVDRPKCYGTVTAANYRAGLEWLTKAKGDEWAHLAPHLQSQYCITADAVEPCDRPPTELSIPVGGAGPSSEKPNYK